MKSLNGIHVEFSLPRNIPVFTYVCIMLHPDQMYLYLLLQWYQNNLYERAKMFFNYLGILQVAASDGLPDRICQKCCTALEKAYLLKTVAER